MTSRDPFAEILGRAMLEPDYRDGLRTGSDGDKVELMMNAGLSHQQAEEVLPLLNVAIVAVDELAGHDAFGVRIAAA